MDEAAVLPTLELLRRQLLDISKRNRLTNTPVGKRYAKQLQIVDERSDEVFRILYAERKKMTFEAAPGAAQDRLEYGEGGGDAAGAGDAGGDAPAEPAVFVPTEDASPASDLASHHVDRKLRTAFAPEPLQKRLLSLYRGARSLEEEQGVSVLFLGLGFLRWYESATSEVERYAPLVLLPVDLERDSARGRFRLVYRDFDLDANLSLGAMLENDFGLRLPDLPDGADWLPSAYFERVRAAVSSRPRWRVEANVMVLGFYSFAKFLMWRDLSPENDWGEQGGPHQNPLVSNLLVGGFEGAAALSAPVEDLDEQFPDPGDLGHILDADASQTRVIAAARDGESMVVQGPPGTGKSQTIANIIAVAARDGKRVLFVAEKRAALDVVHARLEQCGLGPLCLELHSHKAVRRHVYGDLKGTLALGRPHGVDGMHFERVRALRDELNRLSDLLHEVDEATGETPFGVMGRLALLDGRGVSRPGFLIDDADTWSGDEFEKRAKATASLAQFTAEHGSEMEHVWRGARRRLSQMDRRALQGMLGVAQGAFQAACRRLEEAVRQTGLPPAATLGARREALRRLEAAACAPRITGRLLLSDVAVERPAAALELFERVATLQQERAVLLGDCVETALELDWADTRLEFGARGDSIFRWLSGDWRRATARFKAVLRPGWQGGPPQQLALLDRLVRYRKLRRSVEREDALGRAVLEHAWRGEDTDLSDLLPALSWLAAEAEAVGSGLAVKQWFEGVPASLDAGSAAEELGRAFADWEAAVEKVTSLIGFDPEVGFGAVRGGGSPGGSRAGAGSTPAAVASGSAAPDSRAGDSAARRSASAESAKANVAEGARDAPADGSDLAWLDSVGPEEMDERLAAWRGAPDAYEGWLHLATAARHASDLGLDALRQRLADGRVEPHAARDVLSFVRSEALWNRFRRQTPELEAIDGAERTATVEKFRELDARLQHLASQEVALRHFESLPSGAAGQVGIVRGECNKKTRHMPLRRLLDVAGEAVAAIKPVFLMSPLSVAQFLRPGGLVFDLLLIDEASQVRPADAMGAVLRARQVIVVGDQQQLPPTSFFDRQISGDGDDDAEEPDIEAIPGMQIADMESILSLCEARALSPLMLEWHYRSMHPSLIEVSNNEFYDDRLISPPSPDRAGGDFGLSFAHVDGVYSRGRRRNNPPEAEAVAAEVLRHARERPGRSLGVVALSVTQRDTIEDRIEYMRSQMPELDAFCNESSEEPFFVKNLENVQGDERDVIFISIGYGKNAQGYMAQSFGPVSAAGGERRLNVLFTRARRRCRVFSSIRFSDIRLDAAKHRGPRVLRRFLKYAETGEMDVPLLDGREMDSPFEESVARSLVEYGYEVTAQVGSAGFRIDLAVHDPDHEGRFLLAVECDGARYHSSSWARERDRLRQAVLEQKGWTFHRIWSTDWFYNRDVELQKLLEAIERARVVQGNGSSRAPGTGSGPGSEVERGSSASAGNGAGAGAAAVTRPRHSATASVAVAGQGDVGGGAVGQGPRDDPLRVRSGLVAAPGSAPTEQRPRGLHPGSVQGAASAAVRSRRPEVLREAPRTEPAEAPRVPYREASFEIPGARGSGPGWGASQSRSGGFSSLAPRAELHEAPVATVAACVVKIVEIEGPVHIEEVGRRLSRLWGYKRAGSRIQRRVAEVAEALTRAGMIRFPGADFVELVDSRKLQVRDRSEVESSTLRRIEMLPPAEVRQAILQAVERNVGIRPADCAREVARAFGFKATSAEMRRLVSAEAEQLVALGRLVRSGEELRLG